MENTIQKKPARSVSLTKDELLRLKKYYKGFDTGVDAGIAIGVDRSSLDRIINYGSGSEKYITRIREKLLKIKS